MLKSAWACTKNTLNGPAVLAKLSTQEISFNYHWPRLPKRYFAVCDICQPDAVFLIATCQSECPICLQSFCFLKLRFSESGKCFLFLPGSWLSLFSLPYDSCLESSCHPPMHVSSPAEHYSVSWLHPKTVGGHHSPQRMENWRTKEVTTKHRVGNTPSVSKVWFQQVIQI